MRLDIKYRFKISALRHDHQPFPENVPETSLKGEFKAQTSLNIMLQRYFYA